MAPHIEDKLVTHGVVGRLLTTSKFTLQFFDAQIEYTKACSNHTSNAGLKYLLKDITMNLIEVQTRFQLIDQKLEKYKKL